MSRITGTDAANLIEAYNSLYAPQEEVELTEEQIQEDFENWVNSLVEEGHDLSEYTWEDMYEHYLNEAPIRYSTGPTAADLQRQRAQASPKPAPAAYNPAGGGMGGRRGGGSSPGGLRPSFQSTGGFGRYAPPSMQQRTPAPAAPARPAATTPARPAAPATSPRPAGGTPSYANAQGIKPVGTPLPANAVQPVAGAPAQNATFSAPAKPVNKLMTGMPSVPSMSAPAGGPQLSARAQALKAGGPKGGARERMLNQDLDLFDIIKGYLLDEGYADSEEAAFTIMANMSEDWKQSIVEAIDMTKTDAYKNAQTKAATKFYTTPIKPLPPYQARTPRFPALTVPDFGLGTNKPKSPSVRRDDGRTERPVPPRTERPVPPRTERPVAPRQKGTESQKPKPQVTPAQPKPEATPYKGPGYKKDTSIQDMIDRSKQRQQAPKAEAPKVEAPRQPISPGAAGAEGVKFVERGSSAAAGSPAKPVRDQMTGLSPRERSQMKR